MLQLRRPRAAIDGWDEALEAGDLEDAMSLPEFTSELSVGRAMTSSEAVPYPTGRVEPGHVRV